jgi:hypothetical protein
MPSFSMTRTEGVFSGIAGCDDPMQAEGLEAVRERRAGRFGRVAGALVGRRDGPPDLVRLRPEPLPEPDVPDEAAVVAKHDRVLAGILEVAAHELLRLLLLRLRPFRDEEADRRSARYA